MMRLARVLVVLSVAGLAACSGSGSGVPGTMNGGSGASSSSSASSRNVSPTAQQLFRESLYPAAFRNVGGQHGSGVRGWMSPAAKAGKNIIYTGNYDTSTITLFSAKKPYGEVGTITTGLSNPERLFVDSKLAVYASNAGNNTVTAYAAGTTSPSLTISTGVSTPTGITVGADGTVYVANVGNDTVTEYPAGQTSPSITVTLPGTPENLATDSKGDLLASTGDGVYLVAPGASTGTNMGLNVGSPGAIEVDGSDNIVILDESNDDIDVIPAGQTNPTLQVAVAGFPFEIALNKKQKHVYISNLVGSLFILQDFKYPKGSTPATIISNSVDGWPLAVSPDEVP